MGNYDDPALTGRPARRRWPIVLAALAALLIGGAAGYVVRAQTTGSPATVAAPPAAASPTTVPPSSASASCAAVAEAGSAVVAQLQRAAQAIGNLDPGTLGDVLDQVQRLQGQLESAAQGCTGSLPAAPQPGG